MPAQKIHLLSSTTEEITSLLGELGEKPFRAKQVCDWVYAKRAASFDEMRNLPKALRKALDERSALRTLSVADHAASADGKTEKWLLATPENHGVEVVLIREGARRTACVSSSLGCPLGCAFCASGFGPFLRHLSAGEMVEEAAAIEAASGERVTNVVFMGSGEPFLNYDAVLAAARRMNASPDGLAIGARHITVSTVGVLTGIERFAAEPEEFRLAVSLHAPSQAVRERLVPSARQWPFDRILAALRRYTRSTRREVTIEYILIQGLNASVEDAERLAGRLRGLPCKVNCIPVNPAPEGEWLPPSLRRCRAFTDRLSECGVRATLRAEKGRDILAACGQLRAYHLAGKGPAGASGEG
ncbi:MAG: 23S rRNA (adenine(2503)-C(2))-methyltransferase RlmN [Planctomycetota bacterium]